MLVRRQAPEDYLDVFRLTAEAFGLPKDSRPAEPSESPPGRDVWLALDDDTVVGSLTGYSFESWWHGAPIPTCGLAAIAVAPEQRGRGLLRPLAQAALSAAAERGEGISTLFPTANGVYRSLGYEIVGSLDSVTVPIHELSAVRQPDTTTTRRAGISDMSAVRAIYRTWASEQNGPLTRTGPCFTRSDRASLDAVTAITLAVDTARDEGEQIVGFVSWDRGDGYDPASATMQVHDLIALTADGYRALWRMLGTFATVVGTLRLRTSGDDLARLVLPSASWEVRSRQPYMLRVNDPAAAFSAAKLTLGDFHMEIPFAVSGDALGMADGGYTLTLADGSGVCERTPTSNAPTFTTSGLSLLFSGTQSCGNLRLSGHLAGPAAHDAVLDAIFGSRPMHIRDYF